jgi:hypothetical protein
MKSLKRGKNILKAEVQDITPHGLWLLVAGREYCLPFSQFPWFANAAVSDVYKVRLLHANHLYWPELDIDLAVESLANLEKYPLIAAVRTRSAKKAA